MSYPLTRVISILILLDRGNAEGLLFINLGLFFIYYKKGEPKLYIPLLASAIAMKLYPAVFLVYLPGDRKFKDFADFGIAAALTPSAMSGRGQTLKAFTRFRPYYRDEYVSSVRDDLLVTVCLECCVTREAIFGSTGRPAFGGVCQWMGISTVLAF